MFSELAGIKRSSLVSGMHQMQGQLPGRIGRNEDVRRKGIEEEELIGLQDAPTSSTSRTATRPASRIGKDLKRHDDRNSGIK
ncbi:hypothetical protein L5515_000657 [Caenorhabditis briggsae]|uniref:Uncharacterized protein n=1 Tax=Caenorhabditis briggsae TaxID=6238 RepID=A0AAE9E2U1_CAEBR|nr:hypothetical protein L3Y34_014580 [Caenorhabditis briggsae]UMM11306.1 hypothetical protein L5515_000657 [Caenorhabditis briggsae]